MLTAGDKLKAEERGAMLLKLLTIRFGALPGDVVARMNAADLDQLARWFERGVTAPTLDAVFNEA